jgi:catecholate siderophore receptor
MRKSITSRRAPDFNGRGALSAALFAGAAGLALATAAHADTATDASGGTEVSTVDVNGKIAPADKTTSIALVPTNLKDTPQTLQVIDAAQLKTQGVTSLEQALRNVPGITIAIGEGGTLSGDQFKIRGFDAKDDIYVDGLRDFGTYARDSFAYEEVQVLKGPSGAMFGRGTTGGAINTVSKTAKLSNFGDVDVYGGNGSYGRALVDLNHELTDTSAIRLNLMAQSTHGVERDVIHGTRWGLDLAYSAGIGTKTTLSANYLHQSEDKIPDYGVIIVQPPGSLIALPASEYNVGVSRKTFTAYANDRDHTRADVFTLRVNHEVAPWLTITNDSRIGAYTRYFQYTTIDQCTAVCTTNLFDGNPATAPNGGAGGSGPYYSRAWGAQNITTGRAEFNLGSFKNQLIVGLDLSYQSNDKTFRAYTLPAGITARNLIPHDLTNPPHSFPVGYEIYQPSATNVCPVAPARACSATAATVLNNTGKDSDIGLIVTDRLWFTPQVSVIGSARYDIFDATLDSTIVSGVLTRIKSNSKLTSPRVSLVWEPDKEQTYYVSWGRSSVPQGTSVIGAGTAIALTAKDLEPEVSESWEAGAKFALLDRRLLLSGAVFDVKKNNATQTDPSTGFTVAQSGERQEVKGFELSVTGKITDRWTLNAAYSYLDAKIKESFTACTATTLPCPVGTPASTPLNNPFIVGHQVTFVPKNSASFWTTYDFKDLVAGLSAGGGVTYQDKLFLQYTTATAGGVTGLSKIAMTPESISLDGYVAYEIGRVRLSVNGYNLTDRLNYSQVFGNRAVPVGRSIIASVGVRF